jgi:hypothetical protein
MALPENIRHAENITSNKRSSILYPFVLDKKTFNTDAMHEFWGTMVNGNDFEKPVESF